MDACLVFPSMPAVMRLNKLGTFSMAQLGQSKSPFVEFMRSARKNSDNFEVRAIGVAPSLTTSTMLPCRHVWLQRQRVHDATKSPHSAHLLLQRQWGRPSDRRSLQPRQRGQRAHLRCTAASPAARWRTAARHASLADPGTCAHTQLPGTCGRRGQQGAVSACRLKLRALCRRTC